MSDNTITNANGLLQSCSGPVAVEAFRLRALISALKLEMVGLKMSRGMSALAVAKRTTGLRTNDRAQQIARLRIMMQETVARCLVVTDGE